jgi:hypothetical protein
MNNATSFSKFERSLIVVALKYYILNRQPDPIAGGVPYREHMQHLITKLLKDKAHE